MSGYRIVILGLSITSSWGNGHATTYRSLVRELTRRGHQVLFLERDVPWYAKHRDLPQPPYGRTFLYDGLTGLRRDFESAVRQADLVMVGSYVPEGAEVGRWVIERAGGATCFYDIDTPVTLARLEQGEEVYLSRDLIPSYDLYLSFTGGPTLERLVHQFGARQAAPLYCSVDPDHYFPEERPARWDLGYLGTYSPDRQPGLERLLLEPAASWAGGRFAVAGAQFPLPLAWPGNVQHQEHLPPGEHRRFYNEQRFTLNLTRAEMVRAGWSPSVRLFEAAACGVPVISDWWEGMGDFFVPGQEILISESRQETLQYLRETGEEERKAVASRARQRVLAHHTAAHRARELEEYLAALLEARPAAGAVL